MRLGATNIRGANPSGLLPMLVRAAAFLGLVVAVFFLCRQNPDTMTKSESGVVMVLPEHVGDFTGQEQPVSESELHILPPDTEFAKKLYTNPEGEQIGCQIVLSGGEKRSIHRPEVCLPAQGWTKKTGGAIPIHLADGRTLHVMKLVVARPVEVRPGEHKELTGLFVYWFVGKDITTPYHWYRILHTDWDRVVHGVRHRWAYVILNTAVLEGFTPGGKNEKQTLESLENFLRVFAPQIMKKNP